MDLLDLHSRLATAVALYLAALGLWGVYLGLTGSGPSPSYRGALVIVEIAIVVQGLLGALVFASGAPLAEWVHVLYGFALVLALPLAFTVVREGSPRRAALTLGLASFFAMGLAIRGMTTA